MEFAETRLDELAHRIHFATFAAGEITLRDAYFTLFTFLHNVHHIYGACRDEAR